MENKNIMMTLNFGEYSVRITSDRPQLVKKRYDESGLRIKDSITNSSLVIECLRNHEIIGSVTVDLGNYQNFFAYESYPRKTERISRKQLQDGGNYEIGHRTRGRNQNGNGPNVQYDL